jgi:hypothetical protein
MSLSVHAYVRNGSGKMEILAPEDHSQTLAGFETYRKTFYGGQVARSLGLRLLSSLAEADLYCEGEELLNLRHEASVVLRNINVLAEEAGAESESMQFRVRNILAAIERAQSAQGGVVIW